jgi:hypothetical protein
VGIRRCCHFGVDFGILSLTFPGFHMANDRLYESSLKEWVRGLAALVLLFDIYTVYQHLQLQRMRRRLAERDRLFQLISENAADMIAVVDNSATEYAEHHHMRSYSSSPHPPSNRHSARIS